MSISGRKPKPTELKQLTGNPGHRPLNIRQPKPKSRVKKPRPLGALQRKFWTDHAGELERLKILTGIDTAAFRLMADHFALAIQAVQELAAQGLTVDTKDGIKKHPLAQIFKDNSLAFKAFATEFGMTPSSRTRLKMPDDAEQLSLAEELFRAVAEVVDDD